MDKTNGRIEIHDFPPAVVTKLEEEIKSIKKYISTNDLDIEVIVANPGDQISEPRVVTSCYGDIKVRKLLESLTSNLLNIIINDPCFKDCPRQYSACCTFKVVDGPLKQEPPESPIAAESKWYRRESKHTV